ncbi:hypothetical protein X777_08857 [Ooceraea biroi]|uniref:Uncharacterized protein n=1 Tax=Ooceraea biroi TaxID=2015173 RepID=A0A026W6S5_OOCBI|nr:hypothetical protein X777_08857 [Ooceraea biroi]
MNVCIRRTESIFRVTHLSTGQLLRRAFFLQFADVTRLYLIVITDLVNSTSTTYLSKQT